MLRLFQPPLEFRNLSETRRHRIQWGDRLLGLCCDDNKIYCVGRRGDSRHWLAVYDMSDAEDGSLSLLDKVEVRADVSPYCCPRVDSSHRVYVPCENYGVRVYRCQDGRWLPTWDMLRCVGKAWNICVNTADTVFVCDV